MQLRKFLRVYKNMIIVGSILLFSIAGFIVGVIPLAERAVGMSGSVSSLADSVSLFQSKSVILQTLDENSLRSDVLVLSSAVPPDKSIATILTTVDTVSGLSGVAITSVSLTSPGSIATASAKKLTGEESKTGSNQLTFSVSGVGTLVDVKSFLSTIVSVRRIFRMRSMNVTISGDTATFRIDLDAFYLPYPTDVGTVESVTALTDTDAKTIASLGTLPLDSVTVASTVSASVASGKDNPFTP